MDLSHGDPLVLSLSLSWPFGATPPRSPLSACPLLIMIGLRSELSANVLSPSTASNCKDLQCWFPTPTTPLSMARMASSYPAS